MNRNENTCAEQSAAGYAWSGAVLLCLLVLTVIYREERLLNEGAKELTGLINHGTFFFLHPERILFFSSQLLPWIGLKAGASLPALVWLYSLNLIVVTLLVYLAALWQKDPYAGFYLGGFSLMGLGMHFFLYPFLEHIYALVFCYGLYLYYRHPMARGSGKTLLSLPVVILIALLHPVCIVYLGILLWRSPISVRDRSVLFALGVAAMAGALFYTDISMSARAGAMQADRIPGHLLGFITTYPDLALLWLASAYLAWQSRPRWWFLGAVAVSAVPYILYGQMPSYYFTLPCGAALLLVATDRVRRTRPAWLVFLALLLAVNVGRIIQLSPAYQGIRADVATLIDHARNQTGSKFILVRDSLSETYFNTPLDFPLDESIRHSSLLFSSLDGPVGSVIIESYDFHREYFSSAAGMTDTVGLIVHLYEAHTASRLYPAYQDAYEYSRYFFTYRGINTTYFGIGPPDEPSVLRMRP